MNYETLYLEANDKVAARFGSNVAKEIFSDLYESEDEKIRKELIAAVQGLWDNDALPMPLSTKRKDAWIAWLEKQGTSYTKRDIDDAYIKGMSDAKRELEKQGGQKPINDTDEDIVEAVKDTSILDMVEPKFNTGDVLCDKSCTTLNKESQPNLEITNIRNGIYICDKCSFPISQQDEYELVAKRIEQKSSWNVEDIFKVQRICKYLDEAKKYYADITEVRKCIDWLKSLEQRIGG